MSAASNRRSRTRSGSARRPSATDFWGKPPAVDAEPAAVRIRPTPDPAAMPRSLGDPPLGPTPGAGAHHLAVIYEEAVRAAVALAAANGLLDEATVEELATGSG